MNQLKVIINAPAKINLFLDIKGKIKNNYHLMDMIMQSVSLYDVVKIETIDSSIKNIFIDCCLDEEKEGNTAYKAAIEFFRYTNIINTGLKMEIQKNIPISAGLAGGSSDAAAVIVGLNKIFKTSLSKENMNEIALRVGADVPFCLWGGTMKASGVGEKLDVVNKMPHCFIVLSKPTTGVSTQYAYQLFDSCDITLPSPSINDIIDSLNKEDINLIAKNAYNCFEHVIFLQDILLIKSIMKKYNSLTCCMSGSGSTTFGIFDNESSALNCYEELKNIYEDTFICNPIDIGCNIISEKS